MFTVFAGTIPDNTVLTSDEHEVIQALTHDEIVALDNKFAHCTKAIDGYRAGQKMPLSVVLAWHVDHLGSITVEKITKFCQVICSQNTREA